MATLFHGESGTGKTLAAEALASHMGLPIMIVDLSKVISKYIGETEKQLEALFQAAEGFRALLFFDEADSLFGARTGIGDAHDRWANVGTNYLLQRIERFEGVVVLATNLQENIDEAFRRRLHFIIPFEKPERRQQVQLWKRHLPLDRCAPDLDLLMVAAAVDMVGGEIRNVVLEAAFKAAEREMEITGQILFEAIRRELIKSGRRIPASLQKAYAPVG